jgi:hypothetical protein
MIKNVITDNSSELQHIVFHVNKLSELYDNIRLEYRAGNPIYSCASVNEAADDVEFLSETVGIYCNFKLACPFRKTYIDCDLCDGCIKIHTEPFCIPLYMIPENEKYAVHWAAQFIMCAYEDVLARLGVQQPVFAKCRAEILYEIDKVKNSKNGKVSTEFVNAPIKNLLLFM